MSSATRVFERPLAERPTHDSLDAIAEWLIGPARRIAEPAHMIDEYGWRLHAAGIPVLRVTVHSGTLHPQFLGAAYVWWRSTGQTQEIMVMHEIADLIPIRKKSGCAGATRWRDRAAPSRRSGRSPRFSGAQRYIKAQGTTEYFALPFGTAYGSMAYMASYSTDRPGGFSEREIAELRRVTERLSVCRTLSSNRCSSSTSAMPLPPWA